MNTDLAQHSNSIILSFCYLFQLYEDEVRTCHANPEMNTELTQNSISITRFLYLF
eukprot:c15590_g1_i1 orf=220-384(+)